MSLHIWWRSYVTLHYVFIRPPIKLSTAFAINRMTWYFILCNTNLILLVACTGFCNLILTQVLELEGLSGDMRLGLGMKSQPQFLLRLSSLSFLNLRWSFYTRLFVFWVQDPAGAGWFKSWRYKEASCSDSNKIIPNANLIWSCFHFFYHIAQFFSVLFFNFFPYSFSIF